MGLSGLDGLLITERLRPKMSKDPQHGDFDIPAIHEREVGSDEGPFISTNARGTFVEVRRSSERGVARYGFSEVPLANEPELVGALFDFLWQHDSTVRCNSIQAGIDRVQGAASLMVPLALLSEACGQTVRPEEAEKMMSVQGFVTEVNGLRVLASTGLPDDAAIVAAPPGELGCYTRVGDWLGVFLKSVDRTMALVRDGVA